MGVIHASVVIRNPAEPDRAWEGVFLVDTGATDTLIPRPHLEGIGLKPRGRRVYEMADEVACFHRGIQDMNISSVAVA